MRHVEAIQNSLSFVVNDSTVTIVRNLFGHREEERVL